MNEADPSPINLDELRLLPDWLRDEGPPPSKQYSSHEGGAADEAGPRRGPRPGAMNRGPRDNRSFGRGSVGGTGGGGTDRRREGAGRSFPGPHGAQGRPSHDDRRREPERPVAPAPLRVEFLPDEKCLASINKQIRSTHMAYPLFGLARMFLQEPARHWVQLTVEPGKAAPGTMLYQLDEDGPVTLDRAVLERVAFDSAKDRYYVEQTEQKEPPKGNFTNVARNRLSGTLLGPTNYHAYQPALRAEYESRFSRRMSFDDYRRNVEVVNDPALVERWKEEARTTTTIATREGEPPTVLPSVSEARAHFRQHYFDQLLRTAASFKVHGSVARNLPEPAVMQAIRQAHETELRYPAQFVQMLRQGLQNAGLHIFKHRKRVVYVSLARPVPFVPDGAVSENVAAILEIVGQHPLCTRKILAESILSKNLTSSEKSVLLAEALSTVDKVEATSAVISTPESPGIEAEPGSVTVDLATASPFAGTKSTQLTDADETVPETLASPVPPIALPQEDPMAKAKAALAADLRFLVQAGHLIEFHNGTFDLPLPPKRKEELPAAKNPKSTQGTSKQPAAEPSTDTADAEVVEAERATLTVESVTILPPDFPNEDEPTASQESGTEKTEALPVTETGHEDRPDTASRAVPEITTDPVVMGDAESVHPLSPP